MQTRQASKDEISKIKRHICPIRHTERRQVPGQGRYMNPPLSVSMRTETPRDTISGTNRRPPSAGERTTAVTLLEQGESLGTIGTLLGRSRSTIAFVAEMVRQAAGGPRFEKRDLSHALTDRECRSV